MLIWYFRANNKKWQYDEKLSNKYQLMLTTRKAAAYVVVSNRPWKLEAKSAQDNQAFFTLEWDPKVLVITI